ncbi:DHH family phosphoesterase [Pseudodesulfovibrio sp.]|uniref:DHH family phosphoesterase n=1 Tax=Pseudodesulfovibrio sp. TaxID=2035812 RepID=UPI0026078E47|nr:DHH family phosphoesterase [Pseudodesulfovibrio sp.]MDD3310762.1 CBS domain-containing protein [Pseudodesulfovibrio sp.]
MRIITTHTATDFDALASMVACTLLYPGSVGLLPATLNPEVKRFMGIHGDILRVTPRRGFDLEQATSLVVVDAGNWRRLEDMDALARRDGLEVICWDHHMEGADIKCGETHREEVGAAVTLLLEVLRERDAAISPMHATLFLLGIYSDTGCLRYPSVTARDAAMMAFLLENGADLNVVTAYLDDAVDDDHAEVFGQLLDGGEVLTAENVKVGIAALKVKSGLTCLARLVEKYRRLKGLDAAFGVFQADSRKCMVIGRGSPRFIDVGAIMRALGGGGHPGAGSAIIKRTGLDESARRVRELVLAGCGDENVVGKVMSPPARFLVDEGETMAGVAARFAGGNLPGLLVLGEAGLLGGLSRAECAKAVEVGRGEVPVKGFVRPNIPRLAPDTSCREAVALMADAREGILAVLDGGRLVGVVTKADLLFQVYEF